MLVIVKLQHEDVEKNETTCFHFLLYVINPNMYKTVSKNAADKV